MTRYNMSKFPPPNVVLGYSPGLLDPTPEERAMDRKERRIATRGNNVSSMWLPSHHISSSRTYIDPELKRKYTSKPRTLSEAEKRAYEAELLARDSKR